MGITIQLNDLVNSWNHRPTWDEYFMSTAILIASRSSCDRLNVGCILVSAGDHKNRIIAAGYNGFLPGAFHKSNVKNGHEQSTVHAEQNAVSDAARRGISINGATAYITHYPCINCTKMLAASGIKIIKYQFDYNNDLLVNDLLKEVNISIVKLS